LPEDVKLGGSSAFAGEACDTTAIFVASESRSQLLCGVCRKGESSSRFSTSTEAAWETVKLLAAPEALFAGLEELGELAVADGLQAPSGEIATSSTSSLVAS
jgi:hypothetical protein